MLTCGGWETAYSTAFAMSCASSTSPICSRIFSTPCCTTGFLLWPWSSVATKPGSTHVTLIVECSASCRSASEKPVTRTW